jgi:hypothetical protein
MEPWTFTPLRGFEDGSEFFDQISQTFLSSFRHSSRLSPAIPAVPNQVADCQLPVLL